MIGFERFKKIKSIRNKKLTAVLLLVVLCLAILTYVIYDSTHWEIKNETQTVTGNSGIDVVVKIKDGEKNVEYTSPYFESKFEFNAIAPEWKEKNVTGNNRVISLRTSNDSRQWTQWMDIEVTNSLLDTSDNDEERFGETPIFITGKYFQIKSSLSRENTDDPSPEVYGIDVNYIDSREPQTRKVIDRLGSFFIKSASASQNISVVSRQDWGSPDPFGNSLKGTDKYWPSSYSPARQVFLHHTVTPNYQSDPKAVVRAIWDYHANTRGWGDIGYNYVVDHSGTIYEGRAGGDNVIGGHVRGYNTGSMGVAVLGCFESTSSTCRELNGGNTTEPTNASLDSLSTLLSFKSRSYEIDPQGQQVFCDYAGSNCLSLWTIAAHKDANLTQCNGDLFYNKMSQIRQDTANKNAQSWAYNAKQLSYASVPIGYHSEQQVTMSFKNTGTATWNNSTNPMTLRTANPRDHTSDFQGSGWPSSSVAATMNEATVSPGGTGTFTFNLKYPTSLNEDQLEHFRLTATGIWDIPASYGLWLDHVNEVPWNFENLDGDAGSTSGNTSDTGLQPATIAFNSADHIFYYDRTNGDLRQAWRDGSGWHFSTIDGSANVANGQLDASVGGTPSVTAFEDKLHIVFYDSTNGNLRYGYSDTTGTSWTFETLDGEGGANSRYNSNLGLSPSLVSYGDGLQAFYYDSTNHNLRHAWTNPDGTWNFENLDGDYGSIGGLNSDLGYDPTAVTFGASLQLFYFDRNNGNLRHAWADSKGWHFENLDGDAGSIGHSISDSGYNPIVLEYNGSLQLLYYDASHTNLRHAWADSKGWHFENLDGDAGSIGRHIGITGMMPDMAISPDGNLHAFYYESLGSNLGGLRYALANASGWHFETLDGTGGLPYTRVYGDAGLDPSVLSTPSGIRLFYYDRNNGNIRYSWPR